MSIWCKILGHSVEVTHTNRYYVPTREVCKRCGLTRTLELIPEFGMYQWVYSDGRSSEGVHATQEDRIKFGDIWVGKV